MQIHIRPFKTVDAAELQSAILESVGHIGPWLDWATPRYSLADARSWVSESRILWARQTTYRWLITDEDLRNVWGSVEIGRPVPGSEAGRMGYWIRRQALCKGICTRASRAELNYVFQRGLFNQVDLYIDPSNEPSKAVARKLGAQLEVEKGGETSDRDVAKPALHFSVTAEKLAGPKATERGLGSMASECVSLETLAAKKTGGSVYEFRRSLKKARA